MCFIGKPKSKSQFVNLLLRHNIKACLVLLLWASLDWRSLTRFTYLSSSPYYYALWYIILMLNTLHIIQFFTSRLNTWRGTVTMSGNKFKQDSSKHFTYPDSSHSQLAYLLTKALPGSQHLLLSSKVGLVALPKSSLKGGRIMLNLILLSVILLTFLLYYVCFLSSNKL